MKSNLISCSCLLFCFHVFSLAAPLSVPSSLALLDSTDMKPALPISYSISSAASNKTLTPITKGKSSPNGIIPPDPFYLQVPGATQTIKFHTYGRPIDGTSALLVLEQARDDALFYHHRAEVPMGEHNFIYIDGIAYHKALELIFTPGSVMTWDLWYESAMGIMDFFKDFEYRELEFDVLIGGSQGYAVVGNGSIVLTTL
ncbi:hypothetical protein N7G274_007197 [Stereocaulon virgatum]|uniref:Uncharacterized protein n=1 Tax=Stereocaulon virgatum TaxID=373712 RepID=A0ABR4A6A5_9LECA